MLTYGTTLSAQQLVSCDTTANNVMTQVRLFVRAGHTAYLFLTSFSPLFRYSPTSPTLSLLHALLTSRLPLSHLALSVTQNLGCDGGYTEGAFDYIRETGGLVAENKYPYGTSYNGNTGACRVGEEIIKKYTRESFLYVVVDCSSECLYSCLSLPQLDGTAAYLVTVDDYYTVADEDAMVDYVLSTGPLSACVDASDWDRCVQSVTL